MLNDMNGMRLIANHNLMLSFFIIIIYRIIIIDIINLSCHVSSRERPTIMKMSSYLMGWKIKNMEVQYVIIVLAFNEY